MFNANRIAYLFKRNEKLAIAIFVALTCYLVYLVIKQTKYFRKMSLDKEKVLAQYPAPTRLKMRALLNTFEENGFTVIITSAVRANGNDPHTRKHAIDINLVKDGKHYTMTTPKNEWLATGMPQAAIALGFRWGGNFHTPYMYNGTLRNAYDPVHFDTE